MSDKRRIMAGLVVFLLLATFPIWYTLGARGDVSPPDLELPKDAPHCVEDNMVARHMDLLNQWRDAVVRGNGQRQYHESKAFPGERYEMSLTRTCMGCHADRETFCVRCHEYANVLPIRAFRESSTVQRRRKGIRCWDCHVEPKGN